jgi:hypothetical protein
VATQEIAATVLKVLDAVVIWHVLDWHVAFLIGLTII